MASWSRFLLNNRRSETCEVKREKQERGKAKFFLTPHSPLLTFPFSRFFIVIPAEAGIQSMDIQKPDQYMIPRGSTLSLLCQNNFRHEACVLMSDFFAEESRCSGFLPVCVRSHRPPWEWQRKKSFPMLTSPKLWLIHHNNWITTISASLVQIEKNEQIREEIGRISLAGQSLARLNMAHDA